MEHCPVCLLGLGIKAAESLITPSPAETLNASGEVFGDYELLELIGEGGMGIVYKARQRKLKRVVAIKLMRSGSFATASQIRRFRSEAQAAAQLNHSNVVAIHEVGEVAGRPFFTMEFVEGQNLAQLIKRTPLAPERAARYVRQISEAIRYAHSRGVLHRDLKPANVLVDQTDNPRVTDFGLAKLIDSTSDDGSEESVDMTKSGAVLGTPSYMPPEQAQGHRKHIGPHSDVYSLGAVLYDCLTGRPPFRADTPLDTLRQVIETEPAAPRLLNPKVPRDLETICLKCLSKDPENRYASARELADDLDRFIAGQPIQARPVGFVGRTWRWARRNPLLAGVSAAFAGLLLMLAWAALLQREYAVINVKEAASLTARLVYDELAPVKAAVNELATSPELADMVAGGDSEALKRMLEATVEKHQPNTPRWLRLQNWLIMNPDGAALLRWPDAGSRSIRERNVRDYFQGAMGVAKSGNDAIYLSRAYLSAEDDGYKFAVSRVIRDANKKIVGVLSLMVSPTDLAREALGPRTAGREVVLVAEWDSSRPGPTLASVKPRGAREFRIVFHPTFGTTNYAAHVSHPLLDQLAEVTTLEPMGDSFYRDPLAAKHAKFRGWWLAGFARVPESRLTVIYQTRDWVIDALVVAGSAATVISIALAISWRVHRRSRK